MSSHDASKDVSSEGVPKEEERRNPLRSLELEDPETPPAAHAQAIPVANMPNNQGERRNSSPQVVLHVAAEPRTPVERSGGAGTFTSPTAEPSFLGLNRRWLKMLAVVTSLCALAVYSIAIAPRTCHNGCVGGLVLLAILLTLSAIISCTGLCVTARRYNELGETSIFVCGCQRKDHDVMSWAIFLGVLFLFLWAAATYTWAYAMFLYMLFFCIVGAVGCGGIWGTRPDRFSGDITQP